MKHVNLRLPDDLHAALKALAATDRRSLNAELLHLLERAVNEREPVPPRR